MNLEEIYKSFGIDREAITKACADPVSIAVGKEQRYLKPTVGERVKPPPIEDCSQYVDAYGQAISRRVKRQHNRKPK